MGATLIREAAVSSLQERIAKGVDVLALINSDTLRLLKDADDRHQGTPHQSVAVEGNLTVTIAKSDADW